MSPVSFLSFLKKLFPFFVILVIDNRGLAYYSMLLVFSPFPRRDSNRGVFENWDRVDCETFFIDILLDAYVPVSSIYPYHYVITTYSPGILSLCVYVSYLNIAKSPLSIGSRQQRATPCFSVDYHGHRCGSGWPGGFASVKAPSY